MALVMLFQLVPWLEVITLYVLKNKYATKVFLNINVYDKLNSCTCICDYVQTHAHIIIFIVPFLKVRGKDLSSHCFLFLEHVSYRGIDCSKTRLVTSQKSILSR